MSDSQHWVVRGFDNILQFDGVLLGMASSRRHNHTDHLPPSAPPGLRCSACRWFEVKIFRSDEDEYVVEMTGHTTVEGEKARHRAEVTKSPHWVVEVLTQRDEDRRFIPLVSKRALSEAAVCDVGIETAFISRVVA